MLALSNKLFPTIQCGLLLLTVSVLWLVFFRQNNDDNNCEMTYMWRKMHFMGLNINVSNRYSLLLYGEGQYAADFLRTESLNGLPIIFVPGSSGSGKQVRSLGSVIQNKTDLWGTHFHFDTFAVDFNEELTGLSSEYFTDQTYFLSGAIKFVWSMYVDKPPGIVLIGHSMGGIVIQSLQFNPDFHDADKISLIISFATPYKEPPYFIDSGFLHLWKTVNQLSYTETLRRVDFSQHSVSISGGLKDEFIDEEWTRYDDFLHTSTTEIDRVWVETDHNCIIWCNQLVRQISRLLFHYAQNLDEYFQAPKSFLQNYFYGAESRLQRILPDIVDIEEMSIHECNPKCPSSLTNFVSLSTNSIAEKKYIVGISNDLVSNLIEFNCLTKLISNPQKPFTRFLTDTHLYSTTMLLPLQDHAMNESICIKIRNSSFWVLSEVDVMLPTKQLGFLSGINQVTFRVTNSLMILRLNFLSGWRSLTYKVLISRNTCLDQSSGHRAIYLHNNLSRYSEINIKTGAESLFVYEHYDHLQEAYSEIRFFDETDCEYTITFQIYLYYTIAIRRYRHYIPFSIIISLVVWSISSRIYLIRKNFYKTLAFILPVIAYTFRYSIEALTTLTLVNLFAIFVLNTLITLLRLLLLCFIEGQMMRIYLNSFEQLLFLMVFAIFSLFSHSLFIGVVGALFNISKLCLKVQSRNSLAILHLFLVLLQIPSIITYFWNVRTYGHFRTTSDPFLMTNTVIFLFSLLNIFQFDVNPSTTSTTARELASNNKRLLRYVSMGILFCLPIAFIILVNCKDAFLLHFYQSLDDLCFYSVLLMIFLWQLFLV